MGGAGEVDDASLEGRLLALVPLGGIWARGADVAGDDQVGPEVVFQVGVGGVFGEDEALQGGFVRD